MDPRIEFLPEKKLIGQRLKMTFADNQTYKLWKDFMPRRKEIKNNLNSDLISMQVYDEFFDFQNFDLNRSFQKWAAVEVTGFEKIPENMEHFLLPCGLYAVFLYKGMATEAAGFFRYIFTTWLPASDYVLDFRPHFEILGERYKNNAADSEEEIWIPVKPKNTI